MEKSFKYAIIFCLISIIIFSYSCFKVWSTSEVYINDHNSSRNILNQIAFQVKYFPRTIVYIPFYIVNTTYYFGKAIIHGFQQLR